MDQDKLTCKICNNDVVFEDNKHLSSHIRWTHKLTSKEYYDTYLKKPNEGICPICGNPTKFYKLTKGYAKHCSNKCQIVDIENKEKLKQTMIDKYGASNNFIRKDIIAKAHTKEANEKKRQTNLDRYGVEYVTQNKKVQNKTQQTCLEKYGVTTPCMTSQCRAKSNSLESLQKKTETMLEHYGVSSNLERKDIWQKTFDSQIEHYGKCYLATDKNHEKCNSPEARQKAIETKKKNGTLNTSRYEQDFELFLTSLNIKFKKEYSCERYPYFCDFYLVDEDCFIELNIHWTHGGHLFTNTNKDDIIILEEWKEKARSSNYYKVAIDVWTLRDVEKHECAKQNNLNYVVLWNKQDIDQFKQQLEVKYGKKE